MSKHIEAVDHNVSGLHFSISQCDNCGYKFTNPRPVEETIGNYYKSDGYVSHNSTKKGIINKIYHIVRNYQFTRKHKQIVKLQISSGKNLLDIGCGTGDFINYMCQRGWSVDGVETDKQARLLAINNSGVSIFESLYSKNLKKYDVITLWHVLEHVYEIKGFVNQLKKLLKKDGLIVVGVPNSASYDANFYGGNWYAYDLPIHSSHFVKGDIKNIANLYGLKLKYIKPLIFDAYYISMLSSKKSKKSIVGGIFRGFISNIKAKKNGQYSSLTYYLFK